MVRDYSIDSVKGVCLLHMFVLHIFIIYGFFDAKGAASEFYFNALSFFMSSFYFFSGFFFKSPENGNEMKYICMIGIIIVSCELMKLLIGWCESQVGPGERK